jgi:putative spermidine/putrescine transport system ATP-binding protein
LLKIVAGFQRQTEGDVLVDGQSISHLPPNARQIGIVFQNYGLFPHMTVGQNNAYGPQAVGRPAAEVSRIVAEMLEIVQMAAFRDRMPRQLSGGQQQRVALARCLAIRPRILLLDESFSALDKNLRLDMQIEIKRLQPQSGITTILVSHDQEEALSMSDRIAVLSRGDLEQFASPTEIYDRPASIFVNTFVGTTNLLAGTLLDNAAGGATVRLDGGPAIATDLITQAATGERVLLAVRPEGLHLSASQPGDNQFGEALSGRVTAVMPIGPALIYQIVLPDGSAVKVVQDRADALPDSALASTVFPSIKPNRASGIFAAPPSNQE